MLKVAIFIDANNFKNRVFEAINKRPDISFNFDSLISDLVGPDRILTVVNYYSALPDSVYCHQSPYREEKALVNTLIRKRNFRVTMGYYDVPHSVEKGTDINIAVDMLTSAFHNSYDIAILISADQDYKKVVETIRGMGKIIELALPERAKAGELVKVTDHFIRLTNQQLLSYWPSQNTTTTP